MALNRAMLVLCVATALLAGCKREQAQDEQPASPTEAPVVDAAPQPAPQAAPAAQPAAVAFDIGKIARSDKPLGAWPYVILPAGYVYERADDLAARSKDLARVPVWTGGELLWLEGRVFTDEIDAQDGKTYSQFEVRKNLRQALETLGAVRVAERSFDEAVRGGNERDIAAFLNEFGEMYYPYQADQDAETWVIRGADKAVWVVFHSGNNDGSLMVVEAPLPEAPAQ